VLGGKKGAYSGADISWGVEGGGVQPELQKQATGTPGPEFIVRTNQEITMATKSNIGHPEKYRDVKQNAHRNNQERDQERGEGLTRSPLPEKGQKRTGMGSMQ